MKPLNQGNEGITMKLIITKSNGTCFIECRQFEINIRQYEAFIFDDEDGQSRSGYLLRDLIFDGVEFTVTN